MVWDYMIKRILPLLMLAMIVSGCGKKTTESQAPGEPLLVFAAASLVDVLGEVAPEFEAQSGVEVVFNFAGSGTLAKQILAGADADVFISANETWMDKLEQGSRTEPGTRFRWLTNQLVVVANAKADFEFSEPGDLMQESISYLAVGDPAYVPAGKYAKQWLGGCVTEVDGVESNLWSDLEAEHRCTLASDVRSALRQVLASKTVVGVVYRTDYLEFADQLRLLWEVSEDTGVVVSYSASEVRSAESRSTTASAFLEFLKTDPGARQALEKAGFNVVSGE